MSIIKRKKSLSFFKKCINMISIYQIKRLVPYYFLRLKRLSDSDYAISAGFACGAMASFTPFVGFHILLAVFLAFAVRGNYIAALIGTIIGNPITFPFIWWLTYYIGAYLTLQKNYILTNELTVKFFLSQSYEILFPMLIGSLIIGIPIWFISFFIVKSLMVSFKKNKGKVEK